MPDYEGQLVESDDIEVLYIEDHSNLDTLRRCSLAVFHPKSLRTFYAGDSQNSSALYFSEYNTPELVNPTSVMFPSTGEGPVTGLALFVDAVMVFYRRSIWVWRGVDPETDATWHKLPTSEGTVAPMTITNTTGSLTYMGASGIYSLSPSVIGYSGEMQLGSGAVRNLAEGKVTSIIEKEIKDRSKTAAVFDSKRRRYMLAFSSVAGQRPDKILVYEEDLQAFTLWDGFQANAFLETSGEELWVGSSASILVVKDTLHTDQGSPIVVEVLTPNYSINAPSTNKLFTRSDISFSMGDTSSLDKLDVEILVDGETKVNDLVEENGGQGIITLRRNYRAKGNRIQFHFKDQTSTSSLQIYSVGIESKLVRTYGGRLQRYGS